MYYIGIDLGGTNIAAGAVDKDFNIIGRAKMKTNMPRPAEAIVDDMAKAAIMAAEDAGISMDDVKWVGLGSPGTVNKKTGIIEYANNVGFDKLPVVKLLKERLSKEIYIENDGNAAAYGEFIAGAAKGKNDMVAITLGTGVGGGIIVGGRIVTGFNFAGGELGHMVIECDGVPCSCGRKGCYESYASATALIKQTKAAMEADRDSVMWSLCENKIEKVSGRTAFQGMKAGDRAATEVVDNYIKYLACGLVNIVNTFQPEVLCVGGGVSNEGDVLLSPLNEYIKRERYSRYSENQTVLCKAKLGNDAGIIGAAFLGSEF